MKFSPYLRPSKDDPNSRSQVGYSLAVNKESKEDSQDKASFIMGFTFGEAVKLEFFLKLSLTKIFEKSIQDQDNKSAQGYSQPNQKVTPQDLQAKAQTLADQMLAMPESQRQSEMTKLKSQDPVIHSLVKQTIGNIRQQAQTAGARSIMQQKYGVM